MSGPSQHKKIRMSGQSSKTMMIALCAKPAIKELHATKVKRFLEHGFFGKF